MSTFDDLMKRFGLKMPDATAKPDLFQISIKITGSVVDRFISDQTLTPTPEYVNNKIIESLATLNDAEQDFLESDNESFAIVIGLSLGMIMCLGTEFKPLRRRFDTTSS